MRPFALFLALLLPLSAAAEGPELRTSLAPPDGFRTRREGFSGLFWSLAFTADGKTLAAGGVAKVCLWETATWELRAALPYGATSLAFSRDGRFLTAASWFDSMVRIFDLSTREPAFTLTTRREQIEAATVAPEGKTLAVAEDERLRLWDAASGRQVFNFDFGKHVRALAFSPDGKRLAIGDDFGAITFWDIAGGKRLGFIQAHTDYVHSLAFCADGARLASGGGDGKIGLWAVKTSRELLSIEVPNPTFRMALSPDGNRVAVATSEEARLWDATDGKALATLKQHTAGFTIAFSPDSKLLAAGTEEGINVWKLPNGRR